ncbi:MAG: helix-turn-helix domain-containing protein [Lachnospiraceae bacterium]|nr:helix-turn-helix domain-containing protein [Lachnospiraceae bacterium]
MENEFGECLKRLRKGKRITQEQLAEAAGVSPQAVSKWEQGSYPDASLLPAVADCLGVTIDALFGREREEPSLEKLLYEELNRSPANGGENTWDAAQRERMKRAFEICHWLFYIRMGWDNVRQSSRLAMEINRGKGCCSLIRADEGMLFASLNTSLPYFLLMPQPEGGFDNPDALAYDERYVELFRFLGEPDVLRTLVYLAEQPEEQFFSAQTLIEELGIDKENAGEIVRGLKDFNFVKQAILRKGNADEEIYQYRLDYCFVFFMSFADLLLHLPNSFAPGTTSGVRPYFRNGTYKKESHGRNSK